MARLRYEIRFGKTVLARGTTGQGTMFRVGRSLASDNVIHPDKLAASAMVRLAPRVVTNLLRLASRVRGEHGEIHLDRGYQSYYHVARSPAVVIGQRTRGRSTVKIAARQSKAIRLRLGSQFVLSLRERGPGPHLEIHFEPEIG